MTSAHSLDVAVSLLNLLTVENAELISGHEWLLSLGQAVCAALVNPVSTEHEGLRTCFLAVMANFASLRESLRDDVSARLVSTLKMGNTLWKIYLDSLQDEGLSLQATQLLGLPSAEKRPDTFESRDHSPSPDKQEPITHADNNAKAETAAASREASPTQATDEEIDEPPPLAPLWRPRSRRHPSPPTAPPPAKKVRLDVSPVKRGGKKPPQDKVEVGNGRCPRCQRQNINECRVPLTRDGLTKSCRACNLVKLKCTFANGGAGKGAPRPIVNGEKREPDGPSTVGGTTPAPDAPSSPAAAEAPEESVTWDEHDAQRGDDILVQSETFPEPQASIVPESSEASGVPHTPEVPEPSAVPEIPEAPIVPSPAPSSLTEQPSDAPKPTTLTNAASSVIHLVSAPQRASPQVGSPQDGHAVVDHPRGGSPPSNVPQRGHPHMNIPQSSFASVNFSRVGPPQVHSPHVHAPSANAHEFTLSPSVPPNTFIQHFGSALFPSFGDTAPQPSPAPSGRAYSSPSPFNLPAPSFRSQLLARIAQLQGQIRLAALELSRQQGFFQSLRGDLDASVAQLSEYDREVQHASDAGLLPALPGSALGFEDLNAPAMPSSGTGQWQAGH